MSEALIVGAVRSPMGRRNGGLSSLHPAVLLGQTLAELCTRTGIDPSEVDQVIGGCVTGAGEQAFNITRTAWLSAGLPQTVAASTVDAQCGSSQQATNLAAALVASGGADLVIACGVESMSRVPLGSNRANGPGHPIPDEYRDHYEWTSQFEGAQRIADHWGISRADADAFGLRSQQRAAQAWAEGRYEREVFAVTAPVVDGDGVATGETVVVDRDEGLRETSLEKLATLKALLREDGVHTAGTASQISDGASAVLVASPAAAARLGLTPRAAVIGQCLVGVDPEMMLTGPIDATRKVLATHGMGIAELDAIEVNEAFASVVLAWAKELEPDPDIVNPNGGAIALGHPVGCTGARLVTTLVHELERIDGQRGLVTMCCGGGLGTATLLERR